MVYQTPTIEVKGRAVELVDLQIEGRKLEIIGCIVQPTGSVLQISITAREPKEVAHETQG